MRTTSKYSAQQTAIWQGEVMATLDDAGDYMSIEQIQNRSITLSQVTPQKLSKILTHLVDVGMVERNKINANSRVMYKLI